MAVALTIIAVIALAVLISSSPANINRFGVVLQFLGALAVVPHLFRKAGLHQLWRGALSQTQPVVTPPPPPDPEQADEEEDWFAFYQLKNLTIFLGNLLASLGLIWLWVDIVLNPRGEFFQYEFLVRAMLAALGFIWLNGSMLILISRLLHWPRSGGLLAWFFSCDMVIGLLGVVFAGIVHIGLHWFGRGGRYIFGGGVLRVLRVITLPCFVIGLAFQLLATFL